MNNLNEKKDNVSHNHPVSGSQAKSTVKKEIFIIVIVALILVAALWVWKNSEISNVREKADSENRRLQDRAKALIVDTHEEHMKLLAKPYVWAVRSELMKGNINQVNLYNNDMVKEKNFQSIVVANNKGIIISSTNKKNEGKEFISVGKPDYLSTDTTIIDNINDSLLIMSSPIMGFNNKLGTLMVVYKLNKFDFR